MSADCVDIVIVNWNAGAQLDECVRSVLAIDPQPVASVTVVDNGSTDGSAALIIDDERVRVLPQGRNLGFGRACNVGAQEGRADYILLLNPDTRLTEPAIGNAVAFLASPAGASYGICGVRHIDERGITARHCARFPRATTFLTESCGLSRLSPRLFPPLHLLEFDHLGDRPVDHVMGAFYLIRRSLWKTLGGCDEAFFVYLEDLDLSLRAAQAGAPSFYLGSTGIFHRGGGTSAQALGRALSYGLRSRLVYARKHFGVAGRLLTALDVFLVYPAALVGRALLRGSFGRVRGIVQAYGLLWRDRRQGSALP